MYIYIYIYVYICVCVYIYIGDIGLIPGSGRSPGRRKWLPTPVFLSGNSHGQRSLAGYSAWGSQKSVMTIYTYTLGLPRGLSDKGSACQCRRYRGCRRCEFDPWIRKIPWRRKWQPISVFLPGISHGQRSLANLQSMGSQRVRHDSDWAHTHTHIYIHIHTKKINIYMNIYSCEIYMWSEVRVAQLCPTLCDPMD